MTYLVDLIVQIHLFREIISLVLYSYFRIVFLIESFIVRDGGVWDLAYLSVEIGKVWQITNHW